jgi:hypothetical protein
VVHFHASFLFCLEIIPGWKLIPAKVNRLPLKDLHHSRLLLHAHDLPLLDKIFRVTCLFRKFWFSHGTAIRRNSPAIGIGAVHRYPRGGMVCLINVVAQEIQYLGKLRGNSRLRNDAISGRNMHFLHCPSQPTGKVRRTVERKKLDVYAEKRGFYRKKIPGMVTKPV